MAESDRESPFSNGPSHYIGIGASAGGLEALTEFFQGLPNDTGAAYIVVQHLSPDFKSVMAQLLGRVTKMPIYNVIDGVKAVENTIYLIPPRKNMLIAEGKLLLSDHMPEKQKLNLPIDIFFRSLAEDQQHRTVGIILSGTGSDGSRGIRALKEVGGLVIVQDPSSAKFDGMPYNSANTSTADFILPVGEIPASLVKYLSHPLISGKDESLKKHLQSHEDMMQEIFSLLKRKNSIDFSLNKPTTVARRIERRMGINQLPTLPEYLKLLLTQPKELDILGKELLIGVTRFFRDEEMFQHLEDSVIDDILDNSEKDEPIRVWSVACSTGEEAFSLAILFREALERRRDPREIKIFATDVDSDALGEASNGCYSADIAHDVTDTRLQRFFTKEGDVYKINTDLRQCVVFATHNMISDPPFSNLDMVVCRNALIYLQNVAQKKVLAALHFSLKHQGVLFLGPSESLGEMQPHFEVIEERHRLYRKLTNVRIPLGTVPPIRAFSEKAGQGMTSIGGLISSHRDFYQKAPLNFIKDVLIEQYVPPALVLNEELDALHVYGDVTPYIKRFSTGKVSNKIKDIVIDSLSIAVSTAISRAEKEHDTVYYNEITAQLEGKERVLNLAVKYAKENSLKTTPGHYVVIFDAQDTDLQVKTKQGKSVNFDVMQQSRQRIEDLESELTKKQERLQVTVEELETSNEELQSSNEELMSANEELQSTNEELQSVNEELYTVNSEYQEKITELSQAKNHLDNVIKATDIGIIFLDEAMLVTKFTNATAQFFHIMPADLGRPFHHLTHNLSYDDLVKDIANIADSQAVVEKQITSKVGQKLLVRIAPYYTDGSGETAGTVLTFTNITHLIHDHKSESDKQPLSLIQNVEEITPETSNDQKKSQPKPQVKNNKLSVLLVDDSKGDRALIKGLMLESHQYDFDIIDASSTGEALLIAQNKSFDFCILDYKLGGATAIDLVEALTKESIHLPTIVMTGYSDINLTDSLGDFNISEFINKDQVSLALIERSIETVLKGNAQPA